MGPTTRREAAPQEPDSALIRRIVDGDDTALAAAYDRYGAMVYSVACRILRDEGLAEEVLQDLFYQLWRRAAEFDAQRGTLAAWLLVTARNRSIDRLRSRSSRAADEIQEAAVSSGLDLESEASRAQMVARVRSALDRLPAPQRQAMELAYFEGLTHTEIAQRTGEPLGTVKTRLRSALATLKQTLNP